jgi:NADPH:quinone reductase-like Zn-dependent oxidoreductase
VAGERVLITGANGGVGSAAVQIASRLGAHVIAAVRDGAHADWLRTIGAAEVVVSTDLRDVRGLHAIDLALDAGGVARAETRVGTAHDAHALAVTEGVAPAVLEVLALLRALHRLLSPRALVVKSRALAGLQHRPGG